MKTMARGGTQLHIPTVRGTPGPVVVVVEGAAELMGLLREGSETAAMVV